MFVFFIILSALSIISYEQYKDYGMSGFLEDDGWPLAEYLSWTVMVALIPSSVKVPGIPFSIPGEKQGPRKYPIATETGETFGPHSP